MIFCRMEVTQPAPIYRRWL